MLFTCVVFNCVLGSTCCLRALYSTVRILVNVLDFLYLIYIRRIIEGGFEREILMDEDL